MRRVMVLGARVRCLRSCSYPMGFWHCYVALSFFPLLSSLNCVCAKLSNDAHDMLTMSTLVWQLQHGFVDGLHEAEGEFSREYAEAFEAEFSHSVKRAFHVAATL